MLVMSLDILEALSTDELAERAGITYRKLDLLVRAGRITPAIQECAGSGSQRRWAPWQIGELVEILEREKERTR